MSAETGIVENRRQDPRRNGLFLIDNGFRSSGGLDGGGCRAQTGDPPPSRRTRLRTEPGTEICDAETGTQKRAYRLAEIDPETRWECEKPPFRRNKCEKSDGSLSPRTAWWRHSGTNWRPTTQSSNP